MPLNLGSIVFIIFLFLVINWIRKKVFRKRSRSSAKTKTNNDHPRPKKSTWGYFTSYSYETVKSVTSLGRGTPSEFHLVKLLLKSGVPKETIFHDLYFSKGGGGADIGPLHRQTGTPMFGLSIDGQKYFEMHHTAKDVFELVHARELELGTASMASLVYLIDKYGL